MTCSANRRDFLKTCSAMAFAMAGGSLMVNDLFAADMVFKPFAKTLLTDEAGKPLSLEAIEGDRPYIFFYPFTATPAFLLKLDLPVKEQQLNLNTGEGYASPKGAGKEMRVVAYCAICPHQLMHPTKDYSVINYYDKKENKCTTGVQLIKCCAHMSIYDPKAGGKKIGGPAENNLVAIVLEYDEKKKQLYAVGMAGKSEAILTEFFDTNKKDLREQYGSSAAAKAENATAKVLPFEKYTANMIKC